MSIFWAIVLYLVIGTLLTLWLHDSRIDAEFSTLENVLGYIFVILTWPMLTLWPVIKGIYIGIKYILNPKKADRIKEILDDWGAEDKA